MMKKLAQVLRCEPRFAAQPLNFASRVILLLAVPTIGAALILPLWKMHVAAPQYSDGLDLYIYSYKIEGGGDGGHLHEINNLNHYIGVKPIEEADFMEMRWLPFGLGTIILLVVRAVLFGRMASLVELLAIYSYFGLFTVGSFCYRLYWYGHNLDPKAPLKIEPFTPLLIGVNHIGSFTTYSVPHIGAYLLLLSLVLIVLAGWRSQKER